MVQKELSPKKVAELLGIPYKRALNMMAKGIIPCVIDGGDSKPRRVTTEKLLKVYQESKFKVAEIKKSANYSISKDNNILKFPETLSMKDFNKLDSNQRKNYLKLGSN